MLLIVLFVLLIVSIILISLLINLMSDILFTLAFGGFWGFISCTLVILLGGFSKSHLDNQLKLMPNEGIRRSAKNGLLGGLVGFILIGVLFGLCGSLLGGYFIGVILASVFSIAGGSLCGWFLGLGPALRHFYVRIWLWRTHTLPRRTVFFLDDATLRIFLRRIGGGYQFYHNLLRDYFSELD